MIKELIFFTVLASVTVKIVLTVVGSIFVKISESYQIIKAFLY